MNQRERDKILRGIYAPENLFRTGEELAAMEAHARVLSCPKCRCQIISLPPLFQPPLQTALERLVDAMLEAFRAEVAKPAPKRQRTDPSSPRSPRGLPPRGRRSRKRAKPR